MKLTENIVKAVRSLNRKGQHNWIKILCLGVGLAASAVLIEKVWVEQSYDTFWEKSQRIWRINETMVRDGEYVEFDQTAGAVAFGMKRYCPQVECATKVTQWGDFKMLTQDGKTITEPVLLADSCLTEVFSIRMLQGNAKEILAVADHGMISSTLAKTLGGNPVGQYLTHKESGAKFKIDGIYEDIPQNSLFKNTPIILSLPSLTTREAPYDGTKNWVGNDRYMSFVRLAENTDTAQLAPNIRKMMDENLPVAELRKMKIDLGYTFTRLEDYHTGDESVKRMTWVLSLLAFILVFTTVMNYLLFVVGGIPKRAKEMAMRKCYGAERGTIRSMMMTEAVLHLLLSALLAALLIWVCKGTIEQLTGTTLSTLLWNRGSWVLVAGCVMVLLVTGLLPSWLYNRVPVASVFRNYTRSHRLWKMMLLGIEFACAGFLLSLLVVVSSQYTRITNDDTGYEYDRLVHIDFNGVKEQEIGRLLGELKKMPEVEHFTTASTLPIYGASGNDVYLPGEFNLFNVADLYYGGRDYVKTMGMKILQGRSFTETSDSLREVMVSRKFVERMDTLANWGGEAVGKSVCFTEHSEKDVQTFTICGVYDDIRIGTVYDNGGFNERPSVLFYSAGTMKHVLIKMRQMSPESIGKIQKTLQQLYPKDELEAKPYRMLMTMQYDDARQLRTIVLIGGLVTLLIALIGLIGYTNGEVQRRHKEIAIRKVNGARTMDVTGLFVKDILRVALPSLVVGAVGAWFVAGLWLQQFIVRTPLHWWQFAACAAVVLTVILTVVIANCHKVAKSNPVEYLKSE